MEWWNSGKWNDARPYRTVLAGILPFLGLI